MYVVTSRPFVKRTRATLRSAEFGFFGVVVYTRVHTPRFCGQLFRCGDLLLSTSCVRPLRTSWLMVGILRGPLRASQRAQTKSICRDGPTDVGVSLPARPTSRWAERESR